MKQFPQNTKVTGSKEDNNEVLELSKDDAEGVAHLEDRALVHTCSFQRDFFGSRWGYIQSLRRLQKHQLLDVLIAKLLSPRFAL
ncbi:hypothetical protein RJT34_14267 [Clitoria ternatea]|uniref:Uncharacterized protein n=1 Tax=Clitoria ternatea TaxID=43366 RepID=A0AAN9PMP1_CLITE